MCMKLWWYGANVEVSTVVFDLESHFPKASYAHGDQPKFVLPFCKIFLSLSNLEPSSECQNVHWVWQMEVALMHVETLHIPILHWEKENGR
jgi:hypothetical protein